ncbi:MAG TPA: hypothetical protein PKU78_01070 [Candidatus Dojkabacteria bacterium]|nr:hypothetical protein [Candidatus Dojkabacteria bacterium]HRO64793.1 hypothetical protein [Candidatus Dojkabacteria bacterium]HRP50970.1 hypothetical protein [Candidatus Dojkabacteria bacterium]
MRSILKELLHRFADYNAEPSTLLNVWGYFLLLVLFFPIFSSIIPSFNLDVSNYAIFSIIILLTFSLIISYSLLIFSQEKTTFRSSYIKSATIIIVVLMALGFSSFNLLFDLKAPILHDPLDHAMMAKSIVVNNEISFFYSPLLHSLSAVFSLDNVEWIPWLITFFTQLAVFLIPINYSFLYLHFTKRRKYTLLFFLLISSLHFPASFYYLAGKNSLILGLSIIPFVVFSLDNLKKNYSFKNLIVSALALFLLFMAHYPTFGIFCFLIIPWVFTSVFGQIKKKKFKILIASLLPFVISTIFSMLWFIPLYSQQVELINDSVMPSNASGLNLTKQYILENLEFAINNYFMRFFQVWHVMFLIPIFLKKINLSLKLSYIWIYTSLSFLYFLVNTLNQNTLLGMVPNTLELIFSPLLIFGVMLTVNLIIQNFNSKINYISFLFIILGILSINSHRVLNEKIISEHNRLNLVDQNDVLAYKFINENLPDDAIILNAGQEATAKSGAIYPVDGGLWIPLYTDKELFIDFQQFSSVQTNYNNELFQKIVVDNDDSEEIEEIKSMGIEYGYIDQGIFGDSLSEGILNNVDYTVLFESGTVKIIQFD